MSRSLGIPVLYVCGVLVAAGAAAKSAETRHELVHEPDAPDVAADLDGTAPPAKVQQDTVWIADWRFESPAGCDGTGWTHTDLTNHFDGSNYWCASSAYNGTGHISGTAAVLRKHDLCWVQDGYGNNWDYSIVLEYRGGGTNPTLAFDFASDSEPGFDFVTVEADSACGTVRLVDPTTVARDQLFLASGPNLQGRVTGLPLVDYTPSDPNATHCVLIRFVSDGGYSDEDGLYPSLLSAGLVVDNIVVTGGFSYSESFGTALGCAASTPGAIPGVNPHISFVNSAPNVGVGDFARLYRHVTDNDKCSENTTCAWIFTDPNLPAFDPTMGFGPGGRVVRNGIDNLLVSPWVSWTPQSSNTLMSFRLFGGQPRNDVVLAWRVRSRIRVDDVDSPAPGDSIDCPTEWNSGTFTGLNVFIWVTRIADLTAKIDPQGRDIQVGFRVLDFHLIDPAPPPPVGSYGPGPYIDRVRIGRTALGGPLINEGADARSQAQDAFGALDNGIPGGEHHSPASGANDRHEAVPFDRGGDLAVNNRSPNLVTGDSIHVVVQSVRPGGNGLASVKMYAAFKASPTGVASPHTGKVPAGSAFGATGFFVVNADSCHTPAGAVIADNFFVDLPDHYMRGGDELVYFWWAKDNGGGTTSDPPGIPALANGDPNITSVADAEVKTGGLLAMNALPAINWTASYLAAIAASPDGNVIPTQAQIDLSSQRNCILYYNNQAVSRRRSSQLNRTSFMYTLDRLGYIGRYDVYDQSGTGNSNNQLGGRATVDQARGYALIIHDSAHSASQTVTTGVNLDGEKINQAGWYRAYLANGSLSEIGTATLWLIGDNIVQEKGTNPLFASDVGVALGNVDNGSGNLNPDVVGKVSFTFWNGSTQNFTLDRFSLAGGCPMIRNYDGLSLTSGTGTHKYKSGPTESSFWAMAMNKNTSLRWNTIMSAFTWGDITDLYCTANPPPCPNPGIPRVFLAARVLAGALPVNCQHATPPIDSPDETETPPRTALFQNVPNPFNPTTTIRFDLARDGKVELLVFDVAGHRVRTLIDGPVRAGRNRIATWNGLDERRQRVSSGIYFYRLVTDDFTATRKMVILK